MACKKVAKMTQMRHDNLARALRLVTSAASLQSAEEPRYRTLAGKHAGEVQKNRRGNFAVILLRLAMAAVDVVVVTHAPATSYVAAAAKSAGATAAWAETRKRVRFRVDVPDHAAFRFIPFAVESCGYMGQAAVKFVGQLGDIASAEEQRLRLFEACLCAVG